MGAKIDTGRPALELLETISDPDLTQERDDGERLAVRFYDGDIRCFPEWETLRAEPRVREILRRLGLSS